MTSKDKFVTSLPNNGVFNRMGHQLNINPLKTRLPALSPPPPATNPFSNTPAPPSLHPSLLHPMAFSATGTSSQWGWGSDTHHMIPDVPGYPYAPDAEFGTLISSENHASGSKLIRAGQYNPFTFEEASFNLDPQYLDSYRDGYESMQNPGMWPHSYYYRTSRADRPLQTQAEMAHIKDEDHSHGLPLDPSPRRLHTEVNIGMDSDSRLSPVDTPLTYSSKVASPMTIEWDRNEQDPPDDGIKSLIEDADGEDRSTQELPYAQLIFRALMEAPQKRLVLKEIYDWFEVNTDKAKDPKQKGWQNSIRHNLSMNQAFIKIVQTPSDDTKKGCVWELAPEAIIAGRVESTTRYRKTGSKKAVKSDAFTVQRQESGRKGGKAAKIAKRAQKDKGAGHSNIPEDRIFDLSRVDRPIYRDTHPSWTTPGPTNAMLPSPYTRHPSDRSTSQHGRVRDYPFSYTPMVTMHGPLGIQNLEGVVPEQYDSWQYAEQDRRTLFEMPYGTGLESSLFAS